MIKLVAGQNTAIRADNAYKLQFEIAQWQWGIIVNKRALKPALYNDEQGVSIQGDLLLLNFHDIDPQIEKLTVYIARAESIECSNLMASLNDLVDNKCYASIDISGQIAAQSALILLELYRHQDGWKIRCVLQGYAAGLDKLLASYGHQASANGRLIKQHNDVKKITVSKINSVQQPEGVVENIQIGAQLKASVILRWQSADSGKKSLSNYFLGEKFKPISDLRIGCFYQLNNAQNGIVYSFEKEFKGSFEGVPFIEASRSTTAHLERLDINCRYQHKLNRYLVFVTMMQASDNWNGLNVEVAFEIPGTDKLIISADTLMVKPIFAVAMIDYTQTQAKITPLNEYFNDLVELDSAFGWGLPFHSGDSDQHFESNRDNDED